MRIMVLFGGESEERAVSLRSGERVVSALRAHGEEVEGIDLIGMPSPELLARMREQDAVFLVLHGGVGEDGTLQACLEENGIFHYTGSGVRASHLAMEKAAAKRAVSALGVPVAPGCVWQAGEPFPDLQPPLVLKPLCGGSSVGLRMISDTDACRDLSCTQPMLCEGYLPGREYSVGVLAGRALPPVEIRPQGGAYDYERKYTVGATEELCPAPVPPWKRAELQDLALLCFAALGLRDYARVDFKEDATGRPVFLEANTLPGMTQTSLLPLAAAAVGIGYGDLCYRMAMLAAERKC